MRRPLPPPLRSLSRPDTTTRPLGVALVSAALAGCAGQTQPTTGMVVAHAPAPPQPWRLVQVGDGDRARFVHCRDPQCPAPTPKTLVGQTPPVQPAAPDATRPVARAAPVFAAALAEPSSDVTQAIQPAPAAATSLSAIAGSDAQAGSPNAASVRRPVLQIGFLSGSAQVGPVGRARLAALSMAKVRRIQVLGQADPRGTPAANQHLALRRAQAVAAALRALHPALQAVPIDVGLHPACCAPTTRPQLDAYPGLRRVEVLLEQQEPDP